METQRIDKWLWAARFYKTRALAVEQIHKGRVLIHQQPVKPGRDIRVGDRIQLRQGEIVRTVIVRALSLQRGPASVAQQLYEETAASMQARAEAAERRRLAAEPAASIAHGRPTKRDRRQLQRVAWNERWSAALD